MQEDDSGEVSEDNEVGNCQQDFMSKVWLKKMLLSTATNGKNSPQERFVLSGKQRGF